MAQRKTTPKSTPTQATLQKYLDRVTIVENAEQEDAATYGLDRVSRTMTVTVNPAQADAQAQHGYRLRGALHLALSGFGAYHNDIQRQYGRFPKEQRAFDTAVAEATEILEPLFHQAFPYTPSE